MFEDPARAQAAFVGPVGFTIGSRNNMRGPTVFTFDAGLGKTFAVTPERVKLQFRADFFNVLNHPVFNLPGSGTGSSAANYSYYSGNFGAITSTIASVGPRIGQFSLRLMF